MLFGKFRRTKTLGGCFRFCVCPTFGVFRPVSFWKDRPLRHMMSTSDGQVEAPLLTFQLLSRESSRHLALIFCKPLAIRTTTNPLLPKPQNGDQALLTFEANPPIQTKWKRSRSKSATLTDWMSLVYLG